MYVCMYDYIVQCNYAMLSVHINNASLFHCTMMYVCLYKYIIASVCMYVCMYVYMNGRHPNGRVAPPCVCLCR